MDDEVVILSDSGGKGYDFARGVYNCVLEKEDRDFHVHLVDVVRKTFPDTEYRMRIAENIRSKTCVFIHDPNKDAAVWFTDLALTLDAIKFSAPKAVSVVMPYMRFSRQDRKDESRVSLSAKCVAELISRYADRAMVVDLHASQVQGFFGKSVDNLYSRPVIVDYLVKNHEGLLENMVVVSPDIGGAARGRSFQSALILAGHDVDMAICDKKKDNKGRVVGVDIFGEVKGRNCLMMDDIIGTGGTMIETREGLLERGAKKVMAYGTHGFFSRGYEKFKDFDIVMVGDTRYVEPQENLEIITMQNLFGEAVYRNLVGKSLSSLFQ
tara:strand:+ start:70 stop:1041 length:972 start_codon:yes stop_codon:yes gene_type:complete